MLFSPASWSVAWRSPILYHLGRVEMLQGPARGMETEPQAVRSPFVKKCLQRSLQEPWKTTSKLPVVPADTPVLGSGLLWTRKRGCVRGADVSAFGEDLAGASVQAPAALLVPSRC